jgi:hypothetical protein
MPWKMFDEIRPEMVGAASYRTWKNRGGAIMEERIMRYLRGDLRLLGCAFGVLGSVILAVTWAYFNMYPRDRVRVRIVGIPDGTHFICVVAADEGGIRSMDWSHAAFGASIGPMNPKECISSFRDPNDPPQLDEFVFWRLGTRYGVIRRQVDQTWWVTWFDSHQVPVSDRSLILGGGSAVLSLKGRKAEPVPQDVVCALGFQEIRRDGE